MTEKIENVFAYDLSALEKEALGLSDTNEITYLLFTDPQKILSDLHLLFLMRKDKANYERLKDKILIYDDWA